MLVAPKAGLPYWDDILPVSGLDDYHGESKLPQVQYRTQHQNLWPVQCFPPIAIPVAIPIPILFLKHTLKNLSILSLPVGREVLFGVSVEVRANC